jgi:hypothetical protein
VLFRDSTELDRPRKPKKAAWRTKREFVLAANGTFDEKDNRTRTALVVRAGPRVLSRSTESDAPGRSQDSHTGEFSNKRGENTQGMSVGSCLFLRTLGLHACMQACIPDAYNICTPAPSPRLVASFTCKVTGHSTNDVYVNSFLAILFDGPSPVIQRLVVVRCTKQQPGWKRLSLKHTFAFLNLQVFLRSSRRMCTGNLPFSLALRQQLDSSDQPHYVIISTVQDISVTHGSTLFPMPTRTC